MVKDRRDESSTPRRLPYYYAPSEQLLGQYQHGQYGTIEELSGYQRYRYYHRLFNGPASKLVIPSHVLPWHFMLRESAPAGARARAAPPGQQSSLVTIFAIWNLMMGTSLLCLPWAYHQAGLLGGVLSIVAMTGVCFFTASLVLQVPQMAGLQVDEFSDLCAAVLGRAGHKVAQVSSLSILAGGCIVYWVLMSNFLRHIISFVYQVSALNMTVGLNASAVVCEPSQQQHQHHFQAAMDWVVPTVLVTVLGPITCLPSVDFFLKFNFVGTLSVFYLVAFALFKAGSWHWVNLPPFQQLHWFEWNLPAFTGVLSLAMFIHNCLTTLVRGQRRPSRNYRDLAIAYGLVCITYLLVSVSIYISFPLAKSCIRDNFLDNFESNDLFAFVTRLFLLIQVLSLFPLLVYMFRVQVLQLFRDPGTGQVSCQRARTLILNAGLLAAGCLFAAFYPQIGAIIRYSGSFSGMILIFILPVLTFLRVRSLTERPVGLLGRLFLYLLIAAGVANFAAQFAVHTGHQ